MDANQMEKQINTVLKEERLFLLSNALYFKLFLKFMKTKAFMHSSSLFLHLPDPTS